MLIHMNCHIYDIELNKDEKLLITEKDLKKIIPNIATDWKTVGNQLGITNLNIYEKNTKLAEEKFRRTLQLWLNSNPKPVNELLGMFYEALKGIGLFTSAEEFSIKAEGLKMKYGALKDCNNIDETIDMET